MWMVQDGHQQSVEVASSVELSLSQISKSVGAELVLSELESFVNGEELLMMLLIV